MLRHMSSDQVELLLRRDLTVLETYFGVAVHYRAKREVFISVQKDLVIRALLGLLVDN